MTKPLTADAMDFSGCSKPKRARSETLEEQRARKRNRTEDVIRAIGDKPVTERHILEEVGDNRYTREILRRLMAQEVVTRVGKGGSNDPFLYRVVRDMCIADLLLVDPALEVRLQRIESKITALLRDEGCCVTEKSIRACVGDNTGTGKALRRLVNAGRVIREGRGGAGNPYTYRVNDACPPSPVATPAIPVAFTPRPPTARPAPRAAPAAPAPLPPRAVTPFTGRLRARPAVRIHVPDTDEDEDDEEESEREEEEEEEEEGGRRSAGRRQPPSSVHTPRTPRSPAQGLLMDLPSERHDVNELLSSNDSDDESASDSDEERPDTLIGAGDVEASEGDEIEVEGDDDGEQGSFAFAPQDVSALDGEGLDMGVGGMELSIVGRSCGIVVGSVAEAIALSQPRPADKNAPPVADAALAMSWLA